MYNDNMPFKEALSLAQQLGYAEKDPTADIEGHDACRKICIISSLVFGKHVYPKSVYTKGITDIQLCDVEAYINEDGNIDSVDASYILKYYAISSTAKNVMDWDNILDFDKILNK